MSDTDGPTFRELIVSPMMSVKPGSTTTFEEEQLRHPWIAQMVDFLQEGKLPIEEDLARKIAAQGMHFSIIDGILYYLDSHKSQKRAVLSCPSTATATATKRESSRIQWWTLCYQTFIYLSYLTLVVEWHVC